MQEVETKSFVVSFDTIVSNPPASASSCHGHQSGAIAQKQATETYDVSAANHNAKAFGFA